MSLLEIFFVVSGVIILILAIDIARKQKFNALHFLVFIGIGSGLLVFSFFPSVLNYIGSIFGLQRGADLLVYISIIFLIYFSLLLLNKVESDREYLTKLIREIAIQNSGKKSIKGEIGFIVRVYNEGKVIRETLENLINNGYKNIVLVNDGSTDNSLEVLNQFEDLIILNHYINRGGGAALETGFEYFRRFGEVEFVCTFDADGQHQIKDIEKFLREFKNDKNLGVVLGSRFIKKTNTNIKLSRKIVLKLGILFTFFISNIKLTDSHNGYRVFRKNVLNDIKLSIDDMSYASELIDIISQKNISFKEVPVDIIYTDYSISKGQKSSNAINIALKMIWSKFFK